MSSCVIYKSIWLVLFPGFWHFLHWCQRCHSLSNCDSPNTTQLFANARVSLSFPSNLQFGPFMALLASKSFGWAFGKTRASAFFQTIAFQAPSRNCWLVARTTTESTTFCASQKGNLFCERFLFLNWPEKQSTGTGNMPDTFGLHRSIPHRWPASLTAWHG